jgi:spore coat protein A
LALVCLVVPAAAAQEVVDLSPTKDNTLYEDSSGAISNGQGAYLFSGRTQNAELRRAVIAFDPATSIPAGSTIQSVTLSLEITRVKNNNEQTISLHRLTADWGEGASDAEGEEGGGAAAEPGDATWLHTFHDTAFWAAEGGDYDGTSSASTPVGATGTYTWTSTAMEQDVQAWLDTPASNFGWILIGNEAADRSTKRSNSRQNNDTNKRPVLTVSYFPPGASGACCSPDGSCAVVSSGACTPPDSYSGDGTSCAPNLCPQPTGACCFADSTCSEETATDCSAAGGNYQGDGTDCATASCPLITGACCVPGNPGSCQVLSEGQCSALLGGFQGLDTECHVDLCPFVDSLPLPAVAVPVSGDSTYDVAMTEFPQQLHRDLPATTVWGFAGSYPGPTIEARSGEPVTVRWINDLRDGTGTLRTSHYLPVDTCPHGPNTAGDSPRTVVHLHGGHVPPEVDGYPEDTFLPGQQAEYVYPNNQDAATLWYHDHALGITRLNVYLGLAGFYLVRDDVEDALTLPAGEYEVPVLIQDRAFNTDGSFSYPASWQGHFFGDKILVNGKVWPFFEVKQGKYRLRLLNGSNSRVYTLKFDDGSAMGATFSVIGSEGGLLPEPVELTEITISPGERVDLVVDFAAYTAGTEILLENSAVAPFPSGAPDTVVPDVMKFIVLDQPGHTAALPSSLRPLEILDEADAVRHRDLVLTKENEPCAGIWWLINGLGWDDITEQPVLGTSEVWKFINRTGVVHPMHMHLVFFQVLDRQDFDVVDDVIVPTGVPVPPPPEEAGWKDTVQAAPNQITRVIARFEDYTGLFPYHCHVLEHEDHEMMRQFEVLGGTIAAGVSTRPGGHNQLFSFTGDLVGSAQDGGQISATPLAPATYMATEQVPSGWELSSISCDDTDSSGSVATATATYLLSVPDVEAQVPVTCVFTNCLLDLVLSGETVTGTRIYEACDSITATNFTVANDPGGTDVTLRARRLIALQDGVVIESDTNFRAEIDPAL